MTNQNITPEQDSNDLIAIRRMKLDAWRKEGNAFPSGFHRHDFAEDLLNQYGEKSEAELTSHPITVTVAGRMMLKRIMGKVSFTHIQDVSGRIQLYIRADAIGDDYVRFGEWDLGDIVGAEGELFKTKTGELSVKVRKLVLLTKAIRPLPDKFHGLADQEIRYRQRYLALIMNEETRHTFLTRSKIIDTIREFLKEKQFLEVETPMMQVLAGGAAAKPFVTHHHALGMPLYLRIAPELYLKSLVVGGFERVFEINRNFRNEGLSVRHNPEFTMVELYQAYADYHDLMDLTENLFQKIAMTVFGKLSFDYQGTHCDFGKPFERLSMKASILKFNPDLSENDLASIAAIKKVLERLNMPLPEQAGLGKLQTVLFEETVEHQLLQPTVIVDYPAEVSPLARRADRDPFITDRFELFIVGREIANGFSELNDPDDQRERFKEQMV